jgi:hypothetical protein
MFIKPRKRPLFLPICMGKWHDHYLCKEFK